MTVVAVMLRALVRVRERALGRLTVILWALDRVRGRALGWLGPEYLATESRLVRAGLLRHPRSVGNQGLLNLAGRVTPPAASDDVRIPAQRPGRRNPHAD